MSGPGLMNWSSVKGHLEQQYNPIFRAFADVENVDPDQKLTETKLARQAGGFAFDFWCSGGDLNDMDSLIQSFDNMLGKWISEAPSWIVKRFNGLPMSQC